MSEKINTVLIPSGGNKCDGCHQSFCCRYATQHVDTPRSMRDFDHLLWQVSHRNINLFKDSEGWFLLIMADCEHLQKDGRCGIYTTRPLVCREHTNDTCELDESIESGSELFFRNHEQFDTYCRTRFKSWDKRFN